MPSLVSNLAVGLASFAQYEFACGRAYAFSESYLAKPLVEILSSWFPNGTAFTELRHPTLERPDGQGSQPRIDAGVLLKEDTKELREGRLVACVELKWCGDGAIPSGASVLWDLYRLASISYHRPEVECYFVLAGSTGSIKSFLAKTAESRLIRRRTRKEPEVFGTFLRTEIKGKFGQLRFDRLNPTLQRDIEAKFKKYRASSFDLSVNIQQPEIVRHDAAPIEPRTNQPPRTGFTAIASRIVSARPHEASNVPAD
ncbi:MAG: hypothetical protein H6730_35760 [Deltaproteobacteria bacterium]|nr:hypothetical protein [Deltaproteobacteria bacterium]